MLTERPNITGISLPGMPNGSPGMGGVRTESFTILHSQEAKRQPSTRSSNRTYETHRHGATPRPDLGRTVASAAPGMGVAANAARFAGCEFCRSCDDIGFGAWTRSVQASFDPHRQGSPHI